MGVPTTLITAQAEAQFRSLPRKIQHRVLEIFDRLNEWPEASGAKALHGSLSKHHRIRTGDWRVQFFIDPAGNPVVEKIGNREGFYDE